MIKFTAMNTITMIVVTKIWYGISTGKVAVIFVLFRRGLTKDEDTVDGNEEHGDSNGGNPLFLFCPPTFIFVEVLSDDSGVIASSLFHRKWLYDNKDDCHVVALCIFLLIPDTHYNIMTQDTAKIDS